VETTAKKQNVVAEESAFASGTMIYDAVSRKGTKKSHIDQEFKKRTLFIIE